jgi:DNA gyrase subunit A
VVGVRFIQEDAEVVLATRLGKAIRFKAGQVREMGRTARGVRGIRLRAGDGVVGLADTREGETLLTLTERGFGKRTRFDHYPVKRRGGMGVINTKVTSRTGQVIGVRPVDEDDEVLIISGRGQVIRTAVGDIPIFGRAVQGVRLKKVDEGDHLAAVATISKEE